jgi:ABC-2 type transport system permease protein
MTNLIRAELDKTRTTRTAWSLLAVMLALVAFAVVSWFGNDPWSRHSVPLTEQEFLIVAGSAPWLFILVLGARAFTDEFRHGTIVPTLLANPDRRRVLVAKAVTMATWSLVFSAVAYALALGIGLPLLAAEHADVAIEAGPLASAFLRTTLTTVLLGTLGVGIGLAIRHQAAAMVAPLLWIIVVENLLSERLPRLAKYLLIGTANALAGAPGEGQLSPLAGGLVLAAWTALAVAAGALLMHRRDIA